MPEQVDRFGRPVGAEIVGLRYAMAYVYRDADAVEIVQQDMQKYHPEHVMQALAFSLMDFIKASTCHTSEEVGASLQLWMQVVLDHNEATAGTC